LEARPTETRIQMVRLQVFNHTPREDLRKNCDLAILITAESEDQRIVLDLEDEMIEIETLLPKASV
jgi:hypothetical protein